ncbi:SLAF1 protein, partial [Leucopsar rothschildi]|nr:SLAF1 protein [Leucopsar rothschildi]
MEEPQKKKILLRISDGNVTEYERERMRFHEGNFSLEILNTSREDERLYEYSVSKGPEEQLLQIQLRVLEPVADPSIRILHRERSNVSCSLSLLCSSERGDEVSYTWDTWDSRDNRDSRDSRDNRDNRDNRDSRDSGTGGICSGSGPVLNVSYSLGIAAFRCACTASNGVSSRRAAFQSSQCDSQ